MTRKWLFGKVGFNGCNSSQGPGWPVPPAAGPTRFAEEAKRDIAVATAEEPEPEELDRITEALSKALAATFRISIEDVKVANEDGLNIFQVAETLNVDLNTLWPATKTLRDDVLEKAVQDGSLTDQEADYVKVLLKRFDTNALSMGAAQEYTTDRGDFTFEGDSWCRPCGEK